MHVDRENRSAKFWLDPDITLAANHGYSRRELRDIERIMRAHLETLRHEWDAFSAVMTLTLPRIVSVTVTDDTVSVDLEDGRTIAVPIGWYPRLAHGTPAERTHVQVSGAGYGLHWPISMRISALKACWLASSRQKVPPLRTMVTAAQSKITPRNRRTRLCS